MLLHSESCEGVWWRWLVSCSGLERLANARNVNVDCKDKDVIKCHAKVSGAVIAV